MPGFLAGKLGASRTNILDDNLSLGCGQDLSPRRAEMKKGLTFYFNIIHKP